MADSGFKKAITEVAGSPWNKVIVTLLGAFAGLLGAVYTEDIKSTLPLTLYFQKHHALEFWAATAASAMLFFSVQWAADRKRSESEAELRRRAEMLGSRTDEAVRKTAEVVNLIQTLPPAGFISDLGQTYDLCSRILAQLRKSPRDQLTIDATQISIRAMLAAIAALAHKFDASPAAVIYGANVMLFRPMAKILPSEHNALRERMLFHEGSFDDLEGILDLQPSLSASWPSPSGGNPKPDPAIREFALPIPKPPYNTIHNRARVLPGASSIFVSARAGNGILDGYADTVSLGDWCHQYGDFTFEIGEKVGAYFKSASDRIRSMVSLPISVPEDPAQIVGICNIHRGQPGLLRMAPQRSSPKDGGQPNKDQIALKDADLGPATEFALLIRPLLGILWNLIEIMHTIKQEA
jgi:hypothetical protein